VSEGNFAFRETLYFGKYRLFNGYPLWSKTMLASSIAWLIMIEKNNWMILLRLVHSAIHTACAGYFERDSIMRDLIDNVIGAMALIVFFVFVLFI
jgi:hypothetical protein